MSKTAKDAIERNADTIVITVFIVIDLMASLYAIDYAMTVKEVSSLQPNNSIMYQPLRLFIDYQTLRFGIVIKSAFLYLGAFAIAKRLPEP